LCNWGKMEINQILLISRHKFAKLLRSKFYWLFLIGGLGMLLLSMIPLLVAKEFRHTPEALFLISQFARPTPLLAYLRRWRLDH